MEPWKKVKRKNDYISYLTTFTYIFFATVVYPCHYLTTYPVCSDRFLPDKAIDLIDEAGSRVRLQHAQVKIHEVTCCHLFGCMIVACHKNVYK
jgi:hypothetical protein